MNFVWQQQQQPLLCVDINLGNGQVGRVAIHDGDNGDDLATDFCRQYDLDASTRDILAVTLQEQIDSLHAAYVRAVMELFDAHKATYGHANAKLVVH